MYGPFSQYPISSHTVRVSAQDTRSSGTAVHDLIGLVEQDHQAAVQAVEGALESAAVAQPEDARTAADDVGRRTAWASCQLEQFADDIDTFNTGSTEPPAVTLLNQMYRDGAANDFGVAAVEYPPNATENERQTLDDGRATDVSGARTALMRELQAKYEQLETNLDTDAQGVSDNLGREPTATDIRSAWAAGNLPVNAALLWPEYSLDVADITDNAGLPADIAQMDNETLAQYLLDHPEVDPDLLTALNGVRPTALNMVGEELADRVGDLDDLDNEGDREEAQRLAVLMLAFDDVPKIAEGLVDQLGPDGVISAYYDLQSRITEAGQPNYRGFAGDNLTEGDLLRQLQDDMALSLSTMVATASRNNLLADNFGRDLVDSDARGFGIATLFDYGDENADGFGHDLLVDAGNALLEREKGYGQETWPDSSSMLAFGMDQDDDTAMNDPTLQWLQVLDNNPDAAQTILLNEEHAKYLLVDRESVYEETAGQAAGNVLRSATVDQALAYNPDYDEAGGQDYTRSRNAALISTHVLDLAGEGEEALPGTENEIGGIVATYMADVDRTVTRADDGGPGIYENGELLPDWLQDQGLPHFGIEIDKGDLTDVLEDIGDSESAVSVIAESSTRYNQVRMDEAAEYALNGPGPGDPEWTPQSEGDPFMRSTAESSQLGGYLQDSMINGAIDDAEDDAEARRQVAGLFTMPLGYLAEGGGPLGDYIVGGVQDHVTNAYVGDGVNEAIAAGNDQYDIGREATRVQAYYSLVSADAPPGGEPFELGALGETWPTDAAGNPLAPGELSADQTRAVLDAAEQTPGYAGATSTSVSQSWDNITRQYGDN